jgi:UDP-glucose 4-epimerase
MESVVVTGAAGFVGAALSRRLIADGVRVIGVDDLSTGKLENVPSEVEFIEGDVADQRTIQAAPEWDLHGLSSGRPVVW